MKFLLLLVFSLVYLATNAKTYYVSNSGSDSNSGLTTSDPWKTLAKVSSFTAFIPGDEILFKRDDIFYGQLKINNSGSSGSPITIGAYGTGDNPVIMGFTTISDWINLGSNIWESTSAVSTLPYTNMVTVNGVNTPMGRYPNSSFLIWNSRVGNTSITCNSLGGIPDWTGAELAIFTTTYRLNRHPITAQSGGTLAYSTGTNTDFFQDPSSFFVQNFLIQNDPRTLDTINEWYYNPSTKKLQIYSILMPANVQISTVDTLTWTNHKSYITYENLSFTGSGKNAVELGASSYITVRNCVFSFIGRDAIYGPSWGKNLPGLTVSNCTFNQVNNTGIDISNWFNYATITGNTIKNVGMLTGMMSYNSTAMANGISALGPNNTISYNVIDTTGENAITCRGSNTTVNNNFVKNFGIGKGIKDGGGIYTVGNGAQVNMKILNNIVLNSSPDSKGIDLDDKANNIEVAGNTSAYTQRGIYLHNTWNINVHHNTTFSSYQAELLMVANNPAVIMNNITIKNNIFIARTATQRTIWNNTMNVPTMPTPFTSDSNYFARPIDDDTTIQTYVPTVITQRNLASWQALNNQDANSRKSPKTLHNVDDLRLEYNATTSNKTVSLYGNYIDIKNQPYSGTVTLAPYTSIVLIRNKITANAGRDQTIILPTNIINLSGSGTDPDGTITTYEWAKISGPSAGTITNADSASTTVTGAVFGAYQFTLKITDNNAGTDIDTVLIAVITPTTANAGADQTITLPVNSINLSGSGTDLYRIITTYSWTKISGPSAGTITNSASPSTTVTPVMAGTYQFQLRVTNDSGAIAVDTVQVTVNPANIVPLASAGADQTITLPTNTINLLGNGDDTDGSISTYCWVKISGPSACTVTDTTRASITVTGLIEGTYQFELEVTDNKGATMADTVLVTVDAANILPTANAGADQTITLPTNTINLSGSGTDADGSISTYSWVKISGPSADLITDATFASITVTGLVPGTYQFELEVTDNKGATIADTIKITVDDANLFPTANAGADQIITLPTNTINLFGSGTDPDGSISTYGWVKISGPSADTITNATSASITVTGLVPGTYVFELEVTDNKGATTADTVQITVDAANTLPTANAGVDQTITLPTNTIYLSGSGTDTDGSISTYSWAMISGPSADAISKATSASITVTGLVPGIYVFELKVTDNKGATDTKSVQVIVKSIANQSPIVYAGDDQTIAAATATLKGGATDADGSIASYNWIKISGPSAIIVSPDSASTSLTGLLAGTYLFQLMAVDNNGATAIDAVLIIVNTLLPPVNPTNTVNGLDYSYYESGTGYSVVPDFSIRIPVKTGASTGFDIFLANRPSLFSFNFTGYINVPSDGRYTFYTTSDDGSNLYIDNVLVVNNDGMHPAVEKSGTIGLKAGNHAISVGYFQQTGRSILNVKYEGPAISKQDVPESSLFRISTGLLPAVYPANTVNGLDYSYYELAGGFIVVPLFATLTPVKTGTSTNSNISPVTKPASFAFNFRGYIAVPDDGQYTFYTTSDDGSNLYIDNVLVVNNDGLHGALEKSGTVGLRAGKHTISVGFFQAGGNKLLTLSYKGPGVAKQAIPESALYRVPGGNLLASGVSNSNHATISSLQAALQVYPNSFINYLKINIPPGIPGQYHLELVDVLGKVLWAKSSNNNTSACHELVNTAAFQSGVYFLKVIQTSTINSVIKLVK